MHFYINLPFLIIIIPSIFIFQPINYYINVVTAYMNYSYDCNAFSRVSSLSTDISEFESYYYYSSSSYPNASLMIFFKYYSFFSF